ncbi:MAG: hypothetical protein IT379_06960 [Deltaproteobacteria bacterium]|nr:hypothetical protein [Deltaproteobacteria bacterium]
MERDEEQKQETPHPRKVYTAPAVEESADFETLAMMCGKSDPNPGCLGMGGVSLS